MKTLAEVWAGLGQQAIAFLPKIVSALVIFIVGFYLAGVIARAVYRLLEARKVDPELAILFRRIVKISLMVLSFPCLPSR